MKHAIAELEVRLATLENNEPIYWQEGNVSQADLCAAKAAQIRQALAILKAASGGPVWSEPVSEGKTSPAVCIADMRNIHTAFTAVAEAVSKLTGKRITWAVDPVGPDNPHGTKGRFTSHESTKTEREICLKEQITNLEKVIDARDQELRASRDTERDLRITIEQLKGELEKKITPKNPLDPASPHP
jgi:hypothetical protein